jgi:hypothetical protein
MTHTRFLWRIDFSIDKQELYRDVILVALHLRGGVQAFAKCMTDSMTDLLLSSFPPLS